jgi:hypothetical protein
MTTTSTTDARTTSTPARGTTAPRARSQRLPAIGR